MTAFEKFSTSTFKAIGHSEYSKINKILRIYLLDVYMRSIFTKNG